MKQGLKGVEVFMGLILSCISVAHADSLASNSIFAITAIKKAPSVIYPGQVVTATYSIKANPRVPSTLYGNGIVALPKGIRVIGGSCHRPVFNLKPGKSCTIELQITADQLVGKIVRGGPKVCNSLINPVYCSTPPTTSMLNIRKESSVSRTHLSINPTSMTIAQGGGYQEIAISNDGATDAYGVQVVQKPGLEVSVSGACPSPLAPKGVCNLTFTSGSQVGTTTATIAGTNTNIEEEKVTVISASATTLSVSLALPGKNIISVNGSPGVALRIANTGADTAYNVTYTFPGGWDGVSASGNCDTIEPGAGNACILTFNATRPNLANVIKFKAINSPAEPSPYIAFRYGGGLVFSISGTSPNAIAKVVAENDQAANRVWDLGCPGSCTQSNATDAYYGQDLNYVPGSTNPGNTGDTYQAVSMLNGVNGNTTSPANFATATCSTLTLEKHTDWYLPAICELSNLKNFWYDCTAGQNITANLKDLGFGNFQNSYYWSSTERNTVDAAAQAYNINAMANLPKEASSYVRCVRQATY
ncbi:DUF1566 domain-containing protein [Legionella sp. km772]|uniref:Lcl domain-containing protein n=1 Tax=Legionella sp. km772 TaxID=2498111 RepID=UPI000F8CB658|nr:DUF1566 domain-containing protein [Legionella sp. km772]RUR12058.1 DUF1566 domain-containing protein [Legionella sp. km772]